MESDESMGSPFLCFLKRNATNLGKNYWEATSGFIWDDPSQKILQTEGWQEVMDFNQIHIVIIKILGHALPLPGIIERFEVQRESSGEENIWDTFISVKSTCMFKKIQAICFLFIHMWLIKMLWWTTHIKFVKSLFFKAGNSFWLEKVDSNPWRIRFNLKQNFKVLVDFHLEKYNWLSEKQLLKTAEGQLHFTFSVFRVGADSEGSQSGIIFWAFDHELYYEIK